METGGEDKKRPLYPYKDTDKYLISEEIAKSKQNYCGILDKGIIILDFDDLNHANVAQEIINNYDLKVRIVKSKRGIHVYFKTYEDIGSGTHLNLACGIEADIKSGYHNGTAILKLNGIQREIIKDCDLSELSELPYYFRPVRISYAQKRVPDIKTLYNLQNGDGRNEMLFGYVLDCLRSGIDQEYINPLFHIINDYVFAEPLTACEIDTITRPQALQQYGRFYFYDKTKPIIKSMVDYLRSIEHFARIEQQLFIYSDANIYTSDLHTIQQTVYKYFSGLSVMKRNEIITDLGITANDTDYSDRRYISFKNGIYDIETRQFLRHDYKFVIPNMIPHEYNASAEKSTEMYNALFAWCKYDSEIFDLLKEVMGYCLYRSAEFGKFFIIVGNRQNGKSTFLEVLTKLVGTANTSSLDLQEFNERFAIACLANKLVNIGDDIGDTPITDTPKLKKLATGDTLQIERKGQERTSIKPYATAIFSANVIPKIKDPTGAIKRRMVIIPFENYFESDNATISLAEKLTSKESNMQYLINIALDGLHQLIEDQKFLEPKRVTEMMGYYQLENDPIDAFIESYGKNNIIGEAINTVYLEYLVFAEKNDISQTTKNTFSKQLREKLNLISVPKRFNGAISRAFLPK